MSSFGIRISLEVKADTAKDAERIVLDRLGLSLNEWFTEPPNAPPYPNGSLLHWVAEIRTETHTDRRLGQVTK